MEIIWHARVIIDQSQNEKIRDWILDQFRLTVDELYQNETFDDLWIDLGGEG